MDVSKWTPERRAAFKRVVETARRFVRTVDEFGNDHPEACGEDMDALVSAIDAEGRAWDEDPDLVALSECDPQSLRVTRTG